MKIVKVEDIEKNRLEAIPNRPGIYTFWWFGDKSKLLNGVSEIFLKGPGGRWGKVHWKDW